MNAYRIKILHVADSNTVVITVTHYLILDFLPASYTALNENLANHGILQSLDNNINQLILTFGNTAASTTHSISRAYNQWIADFMGKSHSGSHILYNGRLRNRLTQLVHGFFEQLSILCPLNSLQRSTQKLNLVLLQNTLLRQLNSQIQTSLTAQGSQQAIRTLLADNLLQELYSQRLNIYTIRHMSISHNGSRIAIYQYNLQAFLLEGTAGLRTCIVKLCCLADNNRAGTNN